MQSMNAIDNDQSKCLLPIELSWQMDSALEVRTEHRKLNVLHAKDAYCARRIYDLNNTLGEHQYSGRWTPVLGIWVWRQTKNKNETIIMSKQDASRFIPPPFELKTPRKRLKKWWELSTFKLRMC